MSLGKSKCWYSNNCLHFLSMLFHCKTVIFSRTFITVVLSIIVLKIVMLSVSRRSVVLLSVAALALLLIVKTVMQLKFRAGLYQNQFVSFLGGLHHRSSQGITDRHRASQIVTKFRFRASMHFLLVTVHELSGKF